MQDFKALFSFTQTPAEVFDAIINVRGWWSKALEGQTANAGDEFVYRHKHLHYSRHRLTEVIPNQKVVWLTTNSSIEFAGDKQEWTGTTVIFEIEEKDGQTLLNFTHAGLVPALSCYTACSGGWNYYLQSLCKLITTGEGSPDLTA